MIRSNLTLFISTLVFSLPSLADINENKVKNEIRTGLYDVFDKQSVTISFDSTQKDLNQNAKNEIKSLMDSFKGEKVIKKAYVAVWGIYDFDSPEFRNTEQKRNQDLIDDRAGKVEEFIESVASDVDVDTYNMAEKPNWFEKTFNMDEAKLKRAMTNKSEREKIFTDKDDKKLAQLASIFSSKGGANKAVIIFENNQGSMSH